jgi:hypothetical protein
MAKSLFTRVGMVHYRGHNRTCWVHIRKQVLLRFDLEVWVVWIQNVGWIVLDRIHGCIQPWVISWQQGLLVIEELISWMLKDIIVRPLFVNVLIFGLRVPLLVFNILNFNRWELSLPLNAVEHRLEAIILWLLLILFLIVIMVALGRLLILWLLYVEVLMCYKFITALYIVPRLKIPWVLSCIIEFILLR